MSRHRAALAALSTVELSAGLRRRGDYQLEVECLRGWAIVLVFLFHAWGISVGDGTRDVPLPLAFVVAGNTGVTLFFVLSGFLLSRPWLRALRNGSEAPAPGRYLAARALRILPLYYLAVAIAAIASGAPDKALPALWFGFIGFDLFPWSLVWWSLITEVQFYLALPVAGWLVCRGPGGRAWLWALLVSWAGLYAWLVLGAGDGKSFLLTKSLFARLPAFLLGALAAWLSLQPAAGPPSPIPRAPPARLAGILVCLLALGLVLQAVAATGDWVAEQHWHWHHAVEAALWSLLLLFVLGGAFPGRALLVNRPLAWIGKLSYSIYLNHVPLLFFLIDPARMDRTDYAGSLEAFAWPLLAALLSLLLAALSWRLVELPCLSLKERLRR